MENLYGDIVSDLCAGLIGAYLGFTQARWLLGVCGVLAIAYSLAWLRVARRGRLLTWREFVAPWRSG